MMVQVTREQVAAEAVRWVGTPYHHQGRTRSVGCDCGGLVGGVAVALGIVPPDWWERVFDARHHGYGRQPAGDSLVRVLDQHMARVAPDDIRVGDVVLLRWLPATDPMHLAIAAPYPIAGLSIVHAYQSIGGVVQHRLSAQWRARIVHGYALPGVL